MHNMDGFFVAKFKVERRKTVTVPAKERDDAAGNVEIVEEDGTITGAVDSAAFDDNEDKKYLEGV